MKKLSKSLLLVTVALAAMAVAMPAAASAQDVLRDSEWTQDGVALEKGFSNGQEIQLEGELTSENALGGTVTCPVEAHVWIWNDDPQGEPETQARNTIEPGDFIIGPVNACNLEGEPYNNCTLKDAAAVGLPWESHAYVVEDEEENRLGSVDVLATAGFYNEYTGAGCALNQVKVTATTTDLAIFFQEEVDPESPCETSIVGAEVDGANSGVFATSPNVGPITVSGELSVEQDPEDEHECLDLQVQE